MIDSDAVRELLGSVISPSGSKIEGVMNTYGVDIAKLESDRKLVEGWIADLPTEFLAEGGGGWSFLKLCETRNGEQWTGLHLNCESLYVLCAALGLAKMLIPREVWPSLPGGVPYMVFSLTGTFSGA